MKGIVRLLTVFSLLIGSWVWSGTTQTAQAANFTSFNWPQVQVMAVTRRNNAADAKLGTSFGKKLDLNNSNIAAFRDYPGMYPNLASKIIKNAPYENVEDVFNLPNLSDRQKKTLETHLDSFTVTEPATEFIDGDDRFNNGVYR